MPPAQSSTFFADMRRKLSLELKAKAKKHPCALTLCKNLHNTAWLTLTFRPEFHDIPVVTLFYRTVEWIYSRLWRIAGREFSFVPEMTQNGVLHYHVLITTHHYVRLAEFVNKWQARFGGVKRKVVFCVLFLKHHYMRKDIAEMGPILHWPIATMPFSGLRPKQFYRRFYRNMGRRNAIKKQNIANKNELQYVDKYMSVKKV